MDMRFPVRAAVALLALVATATPVAGRADTRSIAVMSGRFSPDVITARPGDVLVWDWLHGGHDVTAINASFSSGSQAEGAQYRRTFGGGTLRYRCTIHSTIDAGTGQCNGMCGIVREPTADVTPPTVEVAKPKDGEVIVARASVLGGSVVSHLVTFSGTATDDVSVIAVKFRVYRNGQPQEYTVTCSGCGTTTATWSASLEMLPGVYRADAIASDPSANVGTSRAITVVVV